MVTKPPNRRGLQKMGLPLGLRLLLGLVTLALLGAALFLLPGMGARPLSLSEALFTSVSAVTVTGLSVLILPVDLTPSGQILLLMLMQAGGIGVMVLTVIIFVLLGRRISLLDRIALRSVLGSIVPGAVLGLMGRVLAGVLAIEASGALLLFLHWRHSMGDARALGYAVFHAVSAFCNAGFDLFSGSPDFPGGLPSDSFTLGVLATLILLGGLGVPVLADGVAWFRTFGMHRGIDHERAERVTALSLHTRLTLSAFALLTIVGALGIFWAEGIEPGHHPGESLGYAFFQSIVARTAGFAIPGSFEMLSPASRFLVLLLMFVGTAPASMGGGITTGTAIVLFLSTITYLRGRSDVVIAGRTISLDTTRRALAVLVVSLLVVVTATWLILLSHPNESPMDALFEVISSFATCGLSLSFTARLNDFGRGVIMFVMLWGRLGPLGIVLALAHETETPRVQYPEEQILIG